MKAPAQPATAQAPRWLLVAGAFAGAILSAAFLLGFLSLLGLRTPLGGNWLVTLFDLNFRPRSTNASALTAFSLLDTTLMLLFGVLTLSTYPILRSTSRAWALIAAVLPFLGILVFLVTATAGRSAVLLAALISSALSLRRGLGAPGTAVAGIIASATLLVLGDFATAAFAPSLPVAVFIAAGYVLWTAWLPLVTLELARAVRSAAG